jgi:phosphoribosylaminoimidazole carboxylase (NCAIR synthetase)
VMGAQRLGMTPQSYALEGPMRIASSRHLATERVLRYGIFLYVKDEVHRIRKMTHVALSLEK